MDLKSFLAIFGVVFLAELGDKTQLATVLFASKEPSNLLLVFAAASLALILSSGIAVALGSTLSNYIDTKLLSSVAGAGFIAIGVWTMWQA
jgi:putative Ca2+/H+ antiporter (TMEM165/GDT1 family)